MKFDDLGLDPKVLQAVAETGYETPTPIQAEAIPHALNARDVLGIAQTGTGKTAAFTMPMITLLNKGRARARMPRSLILCPTRELAAQVAENFDTYGKFCKLTKALLIGGVSFGDQDRLIDRGVDVLIATPGRLLDHFERGKLMLTGIEIMVVDEADRMLDMGFIPDIERIFKLTPFTRQTLFFSATMPPEITRLTEEFLSNPVRVEVAKASSTALTVEQRLHRFRASKKETADKEKRQLLCDLLRAEGAALNNAIVFCNRKRDISAVFRALERSGFNVGALHGDLDQSVRTATLEGFRTGAIKMLVASDVAARGLDIPSVSHVVNYDVPINAEDYVHRIGRTGRAGRSGVALTIAQPHDEKHVDKIEKLIGKPITPAASDIAPEAAVADNPTDVEASRPERAPRRRRRSAREDDPTTPQTSADAAPAEASETAPTDAAPSSRSAPAEARVEARVPRRGRGGRNRDSGGGGGERVVGFGDNPPAFVLRPVKIAKSTRATTASTAADDEEDVAAA